MLNQNVSQNLHNRPFASSIMLKIALPAAFVALVAGHGSMIIPVSRNAVDAELPAWANGKHPETGTIEPYTCACVNGTTPCSSGQGCFWFSQGCNIGCDTCTGNGTRLPNLDQCPESRKVRALVIPSDMTSKTKGCLYRNSFSKQLPSPTEQTRHHAGHACSFPARTPAIRMVCLLFLFVCKIVE